MRKAIFPYRAAFECFGYPLTQSSSLPGDSLRKTEDRLGVRIPLALRDYYLMAGNEKRFNCANHRFLHPSKWFVDGRHIVFLEENQSVVWWGVSTRTSNAIDPSVSQSVSAEELVWHKEHKKCSSFLTVMLHYQAVSGGFRFCGSAAAPDNLHELLKKGWRYAGELNQLWAFSRQNQVVCVMPGGGLPHMPAMMLLGGAKTKDDLGAIEESLAVSLR
jgi:hypothetical protein